MVVAARARAYHSSTLLQSAPAGARMSPQEVQDTLRMNEYTSGEQFIPPDGSGNSSCPVKSFDMNVLRSNNPIEDSHAEAIIRVGSKSPNGMLFGIFDGHGGAACGQVVAKRLLHYVAAGLLTVEDIKLHLSAIEAEKAEGDGGGGSGGDAYNNYGNLLTTINDPFELVSDLQEVYQDSYHQYVGSLKEKRVQEAEEDSGHTSSVAERLIQAFESLDADMSREALNPPPLKDADQQREADVQMKTLTVALSGAVAVVAHIDSNILHVASTGDCTAVIGTLSENDTWVPTKLTNEHNSDNKTEVQRICGEHPGENPKHIIKGDRLMGILAPLRAFGDFKFKWPADLIESVLGSVLKRAAQPGTKQPPAVPPNYHTPPYLTAMPEVMSHKLSPRDKFLVIGSDGLWDMMTPMEAIRLVGEHMSGKTVLTPLQLGGGKNANLTLSEINSMLRRRQAAMKLKPTDTNAATHLIRHALGGSSYGVDHGKLSQMLSLPQDMVRMFRDDITITVVFFDTEYLRHC